MATTRPFAINTGGAISGTTQLGNIAIGVDSLDYSANPGGVTWYMGPDEDPGHIIAYQNSTQPTFWRTSAKTDSDFLQLVNSLPARVGLSPFTGSSAAATWLAENGYWSSYSPPVISIVGYNTIGATVDQYLFNGLATKFTPDTSGTIIGGYGYLVDNDYPGGPGINKVTMAVYSHSSTVPLNLLAYTGETSPIGTYSWIQFPAFTQNTAGGLNVTAGTPIWIALQSNAPGIIRTRSDAGESSELDAAAASYPTWPSTWVNIALGSYKMSVYLEISSDSDATSFLSATGITDPTITLAVRALVSDLKANSLWTKIKALYPFVGGTATTHKYNLKDPQDTDGAFRLTMVGGLTHDANGVTGNGSTGYMDTHFTDANFSGQNNAGVLVYARNNFADGAKALYGAVDSTFSGLRFLPKLSSVAYKSVFSGTGSGISNTDSSGLWIHTRTSSTADSIYRNGSLFQAQNFTSTTNTTTASILLLAVDYDNGALKYQNSDANICTFAFTDGLNDSEKSTLSTIVNTFNTSLSRNIY